MLCCAPCTGTTPQGGVAGDLWLADEDSSISSVLAGSASDKGMAEYIKFNNYLGPGCDPWLQVCLRGEGNTHRGEGSQRQQGRLLDRGAAYACHMLCAPCNHSISCSLPGGA